PSLMPLVSMKTTPTPCLIASSTTGFSALGSVGAMASASTFLVSWSSTRLIWPWMSLSSGGATTTRSTPSSLALASAPAWTAAQNGLPEPGPFIATTTVVALAAKTLPMSIAAVSASTFFISLFSLLLSLRCRAGKPAPEMARRVSCRLAADGCPPSQYVHIDGENDNQADQELLPEHADVHEIEAVAQQSHDEHAGEDAEYRAAAAEETRAADDD